MKNILPISLFLALFLPKLFTEQLRVLPTAFNLIPEAIIMVITIIVIARIIARKSLRIPPKYILLFFFFTFTVLAGIIINQISIVTIASGIRVYFKFIPVFLLPFAYDYSANDLKKQFYILLILGLLQIPVVLWQKFVKYKDLFTGDLIVGTLSISNTLTIIMIGFILLFLALYIRKVISLKLLVLLSILMMIPVSINETKVTLVLLPFGIVSVLVISWKELTKIQLYSIPATGVIFILFFALAYDALYKRDDYGIVDILTKSEKNESNPGFVGTKVDRSVIYNVERKNVVGYNIDHIVEDIPALRLDSFLLPIDTFFPEDIVRLFFGLGVGNVNSIRGEGGHYLHINYIGGTSTALSLTLWETGLIGSLSFILFIIFIAKDSLTVAKEQNIWGTFAMAWFAITLIVLITLMYNNIFHFNEELGLFIYLSSFIVYRRHLFNKKQNHAIYTKIAHKT